MDGRRLVPFAVIMFSLCGCVELESPSPYGERCTEARYVVFDSGEICVSGSCSKSLQDALRAGYCPREYRNCFQDSSQGYFCASSCMAGTHLYIKESDDKSVYICEADSYLHCGSHENSCLSNPGWKTAECTDGKCILSACLEDRLRDPNAANICQKQAECCGPFCKNCVLPGTEQFCGLSDGEMECVYPCRQSQEIDCNGTCVDPTSSTSYCGVTREECNAPGYQPKPCLGEQICLEQNGGYACGCPDGKTECRDGLVCADLSKDIENCGFCGIDCLKYVGVRDASCKDGKCAVYACADGYILANGVCIAEEELYSDCTDGSVRCINGKMEKCAESKWEIDYICSVEDVNALAVCNEDGTCGKACKDGYIEESGQCRREGDPICIDGAMRCVGDLLQRCLDGDWSNEQQCSTAVENGEGRCDSERGCMIVCDEAYCLEDDACADTQTDLNHCGRCGSVCDTTVIEGSTSVSCISGVCTAESCSSEYILNSGGCLSKTCTDGEQKCSGLDYNICEDNAWKAVQTCSAETENAIGTCDDILGCGFACLAGYCKKESSCVSTLTDMENCGGCNEACIAGKVSNSLEVVCDGGVCKALSCEASHYLSGGSCLPRTCTEGTKVCSGLDYAVCEDNAWKVIESCTSSDPHAIAECKNETGCGFSCAAGYCKQGTSCVSAQTDMENCGSCNAPCTVGSVDNSTSVFCESGVCKAAACDSSHYLSSGSCVPKNCTDGALICSGTDLQVCTGNAWVLSKKCTTSVINADPVCSNEKGCMYKCRSGYTDTGSSCVPNACTDAVSGASVASGSKGCSGAATAAVCSLGVWGTPSVCTAPANGTATCSGGTCGFNCNAGYTKSGSSCVPNACKDAVSGASVASGSKGCSGAATGAVCSLGVWGTPSVCTAPANGTAACSGGTCGFNCNAGYTKSGSSCVPNACTDAVSGASVASGSKGCSGAATAAVCSLGVWGTPSVCTAPANGTATCSGGTCGFNCNAGYTKSGSSCVPNACTDAVSGASVASGSKGCSGAKETATCSLGNWASKSACTAPANGTAACSGGTCGFNCNAGYTKSGSSCVPNACKDAVSGASVASGSKGCSGAKETATCSLGVWGTPSVCTAPANGTATCSGGTCGFNCNAGYTKSGSSCVPNACKDAVSGASVANGSKGCSGAKETATCSLGVWGTPSVCTAPANGTAACSGGTCGFNCNAGYTKSGSSCVPNACTDAVSGASVASGSKGCSGAKETATCSLGVWGTPSVCTAPANGTATCSGGTCGFNCNAGYTKSGSSCVPNACKDAVSGASVASGSKGCSGAKETATCSLGNWASKSACTAPANGTATCSGGTCGFNCNAGYTKSGSSCVPNACKDAVSGASVASGSKGCSGAKETATCSLGNWASKSACTAPANGTATCSGGTCGFNCNAGYTKSGSSCVPSACKDAVSGASVASGSKGCSGAKETATCSLGNWASKSACTAPANGTAACSGGTCGFNCNAGYCRSESTCVSTNTQTDSNNCGSCGRKCSEQVPGANVAQCISGGCYAVYGPGCKSGYEYYNISGSLYTCICKSDAAHCGSLCTYLDSDVNNCGSCGNKCTPPSGSHVSSMECVSSVCQISTCEAGYHKSGSSCVADTDTACGPSAVNCTAQHYMKNGYCSGGQCHATACATGYHLSGGVCVYDTSVTSCGGVDCTATPGWSSGSCTNGQCVASSCKSGYVLTKFYTTTSLNVKPAWCETKTNACSTPFVMCKGACTEMSTGNNNYCGSCYHACPSGQRCSGGECVFN